ncbi:interphotoreceptor matrix proteoglycan 2 [Etheostoma spectabile]|uniref:interphotoreceptor matrix proteoglycan 2 n=1 Tax=Etheostoma spectabile TaxID=54343 RepID=UPI0013AF3C6F|nr:interphotoreceptor matrix proteoglycan 2-like [Etheostoma spectabile]
MVSDQRGGYLGALGVLDSDQVLHRGHSAVTRRKRSLFPNGVKLCPQETLDQAVSDHLEYFHLRVCQETVVEAFKIFLDRLPDRDQFQSWVGRCLDGSVSAVAMGTIFSQSEEHVSLVRSRVAMATAASVNSSESMPVQTGEARPEEEAVPPHREDPPAGGGASARTPLLSATGASLQTTSLTERGGLTHEPAVASVPEDTEDFQKSGADGTSETPLVVAETLQSEGEDAEDILEDIVEVSTKVSDSVTHKPFGVMVEEEKTVPEDEIIPEDLDAPYSELIKEVTPPGEEPPSDIMAEEVLIETTIVVPTNPETLEDLGQDVSLEQVVMEHTPETGFEVVEDAEVEEILDKSFDITPDVALTLEEQTTDDPETVEVEILEGPEAFAEESQEETKVSMDATPTVFLISGSEEEEMLKDVSPELESVSDMKTEGPSQASILTTTDEIALDVREPTPMSGPVNLQDEDPEQMPLTDEEIEDKEEDTLVVSEDKTTQDFEMESTDMITTTTDTCN